MEKEESSEESELEELVEEKGDSDKNEEIQIIEEEDETEPEDFRFDSLNVQLSSPVPSPDLTLALGKINFSPSELETEIASAPRIFDDAEKEYDAKYDARYNEDHYEEKVPDYSGRSDGKSKDNPFGQNEETFSGKQ
jgi:hypothetical protein